MTEEEKASKIKELREKLASGRASTTGPDDDGHAENSDRTHGAGVQALFGQGGATSTNERYIGGYKGSVGNNERGASQVLERERPGAFGYGSDNGSADSLTAKTRASGRLVAEDEVKPRKEESSVTTQIQRKGRTAKAKTGVSATSTTAKQAGSVHQGETTAKKQGWKLPGLAEIPGIGKGKTLSSKEASDLRDEFRTSLEDDFVYLDQWLQGKVGDRNLQVWSNCDDEELDKVTDVFLRGAQRSPLLATVVRETVNTHDYIVVGMVFLPRLQETVSVLRTARAKNPRPSRWQRTAARRANPAMNGAIP
jgi:hypothetical protein